jgi:hypothetical protein
LLRLDRHAERAHAENDDKNKDDNDSSNGKKMKKTLSKMRVTFKPPARDKHQCRACKKHFASETLAERYVLPLTLTVKKL